ncbi:hypothetical protein EV424DRAFT_1350756 [Suillus variegatus]|nr:hypothetical protein EV424DRAFT_1350756 [Suillus variegatus]
MSIISLTIYHDTKSKAPFAHQKAATEEGGTPFLFPPPGTEDYEASLTVIGEFNTDVTMKCRAFNVTACTKHPSPHVLLRTNIECMRRFCSGSNSKTCPSEVDIATTAQEEDEEGRNESREYERGKLWQISEYDIY